MFKEYLLLLLLGHVLGDFYIQTANIAEKKIKSLKWVFIHCACYFMMMLLVGLPIISWEVVVGITVAAITHMFIDVIKFTYYSLHIKKKIVSEAFDNHKNRTQVKKNKDNKARNRELNDDKLKAAQLIVNHEKSEQLKLYQIFDRNSFVVDQLLHIICLIIIAYWAVQSELVIEEWKVVIDFINVTGLSVIQVISWFLALLLIHKPANVAIAKLLMIYKPGDLETDGKSNINAGRFIGTVERIIMLIFLSTGQYSAIGLVLTAKSIARYDRITKDPAFAEYYLLGTLLSTLIVILTSFIL
jgi:hypothetical protein